MKKSAPRKMAKKSLKEERLAIKVYKQRSRKTGDKKLKKNFHHVIPEERDHAKKFKRYLKGKK